MTVKIRPVGATEWVTLEGASAEIGPALAHVHYEPVGGLDVFLPHPRFTVDLHPVVLTAFGYRWIMHTLAVAIDAQYGRVATTRNPPKQPVPVKRSKR